MATDFPERLAEASWCDPPAKITLASDEVHIWRGNLDLPSTYLDLLRQLLSPDERERADRYVFARDRNHFLVARGFLRLILAAYLECPAAAIQFVYDKYGKPRISDFDGKCKLNFNLAHSGGLTIYGVTLDREIGVDVEKIRADLPGVAIAQRYFSAGDVERLFLFPPTERQESFFHGWTRKEAFIKAIGSGLSLPLDQFDVTLSPAEPASLLETRWDKSEAARWSLRAINVGPDYAACIAVEGHGWNLKCWHAQTAMVSRFQDNASERISNPP